MTSLQIQGCEVKEIKTKGSSNQVEGIIVKAFLPWTIGN
jgi:hypothetical protein